MTPFTTTIDDRVQMLRSCLWAQDLPDHAIRAVAARAQAFRISTDAALVEENATDNWMAFVIQGECEISQSMLAADARVLRVIGPGRVFGEMSLLDGEPRSATITAITETVVLRIHAREVEAMSTEDPAAAYALMRRIAVDLARRIRTLQRNSNS